MAGRIAALRRRMQGSRRTIPELQADSEVECGAVCLAMVLGYYGKDTPVAEAHERCRVGRDGATALDIATAARSYGLRVTPYSLDLDELADLRTPAVLHWSFVHFVVLERMTRDGAVICDPAGGRREIDRDELSENFTGVALAVEPGESFDPHDQTDVDPAWKLLGRRAFRAPGVRKLVAQILVASLALQLLGLSVPLLTKTVINTILPQQLDDVMTILGLGIAVILVTQLLMGLLRGLVLVNFQARLDNELMVSFFEHVLSLPLPYFQERSTGDLIQRLGSNAEIRNVLSSQTLGAFLDGTFVIVYAVIMIVTSPVFGLLAVALGAIQIGLLIATARRMTSLVKAELGAQGSAQGFLVESLSGIQAIKAAGSEDRTLSRYNGVFAEQIHTLIQRGQLQSIIGSVTSAVQRLAPLLLMWMGARLVLDEQLDLGTMLAMIALAQLFLAPLSSLVTAGMQLQQVGGHLERIAYVLRASPEQDRRSVRVAPPLRGKVEFDDVSFRYDESSPWAVRHFELTIEPGRKVALVGATGSGKSTVAKLMLGLYEPTEGEIRIDGIPLRELDLRTVREQCGVVMQEPTVFSGSVRRNISYNDPSLPLESIVRAAKLADLHDDISRMPMGYDTPVAEGGSALSGGQRQRLAIARALARDPRILVLDEATSALDSVTETAVAEHLEASGAASLVIAHRLSTVQSADLTLVLEDGEVVERGTHDELIDRHGVYARLVADQLVSGQERA
jgi:ATP-binding cassette subfamily B protein